MNNNVYNKQIHKGLLIQGKLKEAVAYLCQFPQKKNIINKYYNIFKNENPKFSFRSRNVNINKVLTLYYRYYIKMFWDGASVDEGKKYFVNNFKQSYNTNDLNDLDEIEDYLKDIVEKEGYHFLGGETSSYLGPYIWKETIPTIYDVQIPDGTYKLTVNMMDGFVSKGWLDFISFGVTGAGGWAKEEGLYCIKEAYENRFAKPQFTISYLKHEAQHAADLSKYKNIESKDLEYRAKLTELVYFPNLKLLKAFIAASDSTSKKNSHSYSSYVIVSNLSKKIFGEVFVSDSLRWRNKLKQVKPTALILLNENTLLIEKSLNDRIDII